jgi:hypothetical protein
MTTLESGIPQGSVLGPFLFSVYVSPLSRIIPETIKFHQYADDTQLYCSVSAKNFSTDVIALQDCVSAVATWFLKNGMMLNADKTEAMLFSTIYESKNLPPNSSVDIAGFPTKLVPEVKSLGVIMDSRLSMDQHVNYVCKKCYFHIRALRQIRPCLSNSVASNVGRCIVQANLDYCNSLLSETTQKNLNKLQRVQNSLVRVVCELRWREHVTVARRKLHWLPVANRIKYKLASIVYSCLLGTAPTYLCDLITEYIPTRDLRSSHANLLVEPRTKTVLAERAFSFSGPKLWNSLPAVLKSSPSLNVFKKNLKTFLFDFN